MLWPEKTTSTMMKNSCSASAHLKFITITLVPSRGHNIRSSRSHGLQRLNHHSSRMSRVNNNNGVHSVEASSGLQCVGVCQLDRPGHFLRFVCFKSQGNMVQIVARWPRPVVSSVTQDILHRAMCVLSIAPADCQGHQHGQLKRCVF